MEYHPAIATGNTAVITGAADGIGFAAAKRFAALGLHVLLADNNETKLTGAAAAVKDAARGDGIRIETRVTDVSRFDQVQALKDDAYTTFGRVDVLMNNAGTSVKTTSWSDLESWHHLLDVNFWGIIHGVQAFTQAMIDQNEPALMINTGSKQGITNPPGNPAYNVSKAAVKAATESLQHALRNTPECRLRAHLLVPGYTFTGLTKNADKGKPAGAWTPDQVVDYLLEAIAENRFYVICPDNEVSSAEDARRILWAADDLAKQRTPLSRWDPDYAAAFAAFKI